MRVPAEHGAARGDLSLFIGCLLLSLVAMALPRPWVSGLTTALRGSVLRPLVYLQERAILDRTARFEVPQIRALNDSLEMVVQGQAAMELENHNLRTLLELRSRVPIPFRSAELIHQSSVVDDRMLLVNLGSADGIHQFDPVITADGLLGYVWDTEVHSAMVLTWIHPEFRAHAVTGDGAVMGMIGPSRSGSNLTLLELRGVALRDTLLPGVVVYTSSLGSVYPRGIPIGTVVGSSGDSLSVERIYQVVPFVNPGRATHVMILQPERGATFLPLPAEGNPE